jgi:hypothetical protein
MSRVYQTAEKVIVWLGPSSCEIDCLFHWMNALDQQMLQVARPHTINTWQAQWALLNFRLHGEPPSEEMKKTLQGLLRGEWFSRVWVVQEAALAKSAVIVSGDNAVNSRALVAMPSILHVDSGEGTQARLEILPGRLREEARISGDVCKDLLTLLQKFGRSKSSDPRDVIYALLGLSSDAH